MNSEQRIANHDELWNKAQRAGMSRRQFLILLGSSGAAAVLAACSSRVAPLTTAPGPEGDLRVALGSFGSEGFFPPREDVTTNSSINSPIFDSLIRVDDRANLVPGLLDKWEISADGLSWTLRVRPGIKFQNGEALTAEDVKFSLDYYTGKEARATNLRNSVTSVAIVDENTLRVNTKGVQVYLPALIATFPPGQGYIVPKDYATERGVDYAQKNPVGSGPFKLVQHNKGDRIQYEALSQHWRQVPSFKTLTLFLVPEESTRVAMLKTGAVDVTEVGLDNTVELEKAGFKTVDADIHAPWLGFYGAFDPAVNAPFADIRVRKALSLAINRDEISKTLFHGKTTPSLPIGLTPIVQDVDLAWAQQYAASIYRYDPDEAKRLLKEARPGGTSLKFYSTQQSGAPYMPKLIEVIAGYWQAAGVKVELVPMDYGALSAITGGPKTLGNAILLRYGATAVGLTPISSFFQSTGRQKFLGKTRPDVDQLYNKVSAETDPARRKQLLKELIQTTAETYTVLGFPSIPVQYVVGPRVDLKIPGAIWPAVGFGLLADVARHGK